MTTPADPWLDYNSVPFENATSDGTPILNVETLGSITNLFISNQTNSDIIVYVNLKRGGVTYLLFTAPLAAYEGINVLNGQLLIIYAYDSISIQTDAPTNWASGVLNYVYFNTLTGTSPFLNYLSSPFSNVNSDGEPILATIVKGTISNLLISNQTNGNIIVYVVFIRDDISYTILTAPLTAYQGMSIFNSQLLIVNPEDILSIHTDAPTNLVSGLLSYVEFSELA